jgi:hypothetical protein
MVPGIDASPACLSEDDLLLVSGNNPDRYALAELGGDLDSDGARNENSRIGRIVFENFTDGYACFESAKGLVQVAAAYILLVAATLNALMDWM